MDFNNFKENGIDTFLRTTLWAKKVNVPAGFSFIILERLHERQIYKAALARRTAAFSVIAAFGTSVLLLSFFPAFAAGISIYIQEYLSAMYSGIGLLKSLFSIVGFTIVAIYAFYALIDF